MLKKWRPSKQWIGVFISLIVTVVLAFSFSYIADRINPKQNDNQTLTQYDAPEMKLNFQLRGEKQKEELKVTFSKEQKQQNPNKQVPLSFEKKTTTNNEDESNFQGMIFSGLIIFILVSGIGIVLYTQLRSARRSNEIGGM